MVFDPFTAVAGGLSFASKLFGGGGGGGNAQQIYEEQKAAAAAAAKVANDYQDVQFSALVQDTLAAEDYQWNLAKDNWQQQVDIQDYEYLQEQKLYQKSLGIATSQLDLNDLSQEQAFKFEDFALTNVFTQKTFSQESELLAMEQAIAANDLNKKSTQLDLQGIDLASKELGIKQFALTKEAEFIGQENLQLDQQHAIAQQFVLDQLDEAKREAAFKKQGAYVETLNKVGKALTGQSGKSLGKTEQSTLAEFFMGMGALESSLTGQGRQAALKLKELYTQTSFEEAKLQFKLQNMGLQSQTYSLQQQKFGLQSGAIDVQQQKYNSALQNQLDNSAFNMKVIDKEVMTAAEQALLNKSQISVSKAGADLNAVAQMKIQPQKLPYLNQPIKQPSKTITKPPAITPDYIPPPLKQSGLSTVANVVSGLSDLASGFQGLKIGGNSSSGSGGKKPTSSNDNKKG